MPVRHELARLLARRAEPEPVHDVVQAQLQVTQEVDAGHARLGRGLVEVVAELLLEQAVDAARLLLRAKLDAVVRRLALARLPVHARREGAALDGALRRVAALALEVELGALAAAEAADRAAVVRHPLDPPPLGWAAAVVGDRGHVGDRAHLESGRLQGADRRLTARAPPPDQHPDASRAMLELP